LIGLLETRRWDVVLIDHIGMGWALEVLKTRWVRRSVGQLLVFVSHNHEASTRFRMADNYDGLALMRLALRTDARKTARLERVLVEAADLVTVNSVEDRGLFAVAHPSRRYLVLTPGYGRRILSKRVITHRDPRRVVVLGSFEWLAKQIDLREFLRVADPVFKESGAEIVIVGRVPDSLVDELRKRLRATRFSGAVEDVSSSLDGARVGIVPERTGHGFKHKVLDYVFNGIPVAAIEHSVTGMPLVPGESFLAYPDMATLCRGVLAILDDIPRLNDIQERALAVCTGRFDWEPRGQELLRELKHLAKGRMPTE